MTEASNYLRTIAERIARAYCMLPGVQAAMLTGSATLGISDYHSDVDMSIYYDTLPPESEIRAVEMNLLGVTELVWTLGDHAEGEVAYAFKINGVECQVGHVTIANLERDIEAVLSASEVKTPLQKVCSGLSDCLPLYGEPIIARWKARVADYPEPLAKAMVEQHLSFFAIWSSYSWLAPRDITPFLYQTLVEAVFNILGVLAGLNRLYFSSFQLKRTGQFVAKMKIAPPHLSERITQILRDPPENAVLVLKELVQETVALVEQEMPDIDTSRARWALDRVYLPWTPES